MKFAGTAEAMKEKKISAVLKPQESMYVKKQKKADL